MVSSPVPTRAEVNDIYNSMLDGADGLVLAAETAIGQHPVASATMIRRLGDQFLKDTNTAPAASSPRIGPLEPHGGVLVSADAEPDLIERARAGALPEILVDEMALSDLQNICDGTYSPVDGFMTSLELNGVLNEHRLVDGTVWTLPIVLPVPSDRLSQLAPGNLAVIRGLNNQVHSVIDISEIYESSAKAWASAWFGTDDEAYPGLKSLVGRGDHFVAGKGHLIRQDQPLYPAWQLSPTAIRSIFHQKGRNRVVGFHSRNVHHQVHVHLQLEALRETGADGLLINPVFGFKKPGDFLSDVIMDGYDALLKASVYRANAAFLTGFATYSRYAGPREAVFTALCRKNMGCRHFIVGRDHTGVAKYYGEDAVPALFDALPGIGITPVFFPTHVYDAADGIYVPKAEAKSLRSISGTAARSSLLAGEHPPDWYIHPVVQQVLARRLKMGQPLFH
jgi:ATP sulfurylase